jgi:hypothetical protein
LLTLCFLKNGWLLQRLEADYKAVTDKEKEDVVALGGLHVVGTERHVSGSICSHPTVSGQSADASLRKHVQWDR